MGRDSGWVLRVAAGWLEPGRDFYDVHPKNWSSWILRLVALVCLACVISIPFAAAQTFAGKNAGSPTGQSSKAAKAGGETPGPIDAGVDGGCFRAAVGSELPEPEDLRSIDGILKVDLAFRSFIDSKGEVRYCYVTLNGKQSPTLRVKPGDTVILNFKNEATAAPPQTRPATPAAGAVAASTAAADASAHSGMQMNSATPAAAP